jgi:hypothetical protein
MHSCQSERSRQFIVNLIWQQTLSIFSVTCRIISIIALLHLWTLRYHRFACVRAHVTWLSKEWWWPMKWIDSLNKQSRWSASCTQAVRHSDRSCWQAYDRWNEAHSAKRAARSTVLHCSTHRRGAAHRVTCSCSLLRRQTRPQYVRLISTGWSGFHCIRVKRVLLLSVHTDDFENRARGSANTARLPVFVTRFVCFRVSVC